MNTSLEIIVAILPLIKKSFDGDNRKLAKAASVVFGKNKRDISSVEENAIYYSLEAVDFCFKKTVHESSILDLALKIALLVLISSPFHVSFLVREKVFQFLEPSKDEVIDLPEECIGEIRALEKRWQKQGLSDEEIQANIKFFKRDMQIGQRNMKKGEIKHKAWSLFMKVILQLGESLSI